VRVNVVPYDPAWPATFDALRADLGRALADVPIIAIEHVGSTSVPGLAAKPVIDIDIIVARADVARACAALAAIGYIPLGEMGVPGREAFHTPTDGIARNVYVTVDNCLSLRNHLALRAVLRANPALRDEYGALKLSLAQQDLASIDEYVVRKSPVVQRILERGGLSIAERAEIDGINQLPE
jgi:GrpB-like predicted nucleotidyltransferase (UPF0157 family)